MHTMLVVSIVSVSVICWSSYTLGCLRITTFSTCSFNSSFNTVKRWSSNFSPIVVTYTITLSLTGITRCRFAADAKGELLLASSMA